MDKIFLPCLVPIVTTAARVCRMFRRTHGGALKKFAATESGATAIEYALVAALISVAILVALTGVSDTMRSTYYDLINNAFN